LTNEASLTPSEVADDEVLARFIVASSWVRATDNSVKQDAFIPPPNLELSVSRHVNITDEELWQLGCDVAANRQRQLYGRADFLAAQARGLALQLEPLEPPKNHACVMGWPPDKPSQKIIAQKLAAMSKFVATPSLTAS
jgi:hypothetical protein